MSSTETGVIFGNIVYEGSGYAERSVVVLADIHIDIMDYISPAVCADVTFRNMWAEFEWENKVSCEAGGGASIERQSDKQWFGVQGWWRGGSWSKGKRVSCYEPASSSCKRSVWHHTPRITFCLLADNAPLPFAPICCQLYRWPSTPASPT